jgi:hypothetical protein
VSSPDVPVADYQHAVLVAIDLAEFTEPSPD